MAVAVELGQVDHFHPHVLEHPHEIGRRPAIPLAFSSSAAIAIAMCQWLAKV